ncbi:hypothetical protein ACFVW1_40930 [Streptomyces olivochromogenes]|uniref:hypothetical protein n=1 Tax=Streptomyces olivochromogenes TaxID=1963 RepID=UPI0036D993AC
MPAASGSVAVSGQTPANEAAAFALAVAAAAAPAAAIARCEQQLNGSPPVPDGGTPAS